MSNEYALVHNHDIVEIVNYEINPTGGEPGLHRLRPIVTQEKPPFDDKVEYLQNVYEIRDNEVIRSFRVVNRAHPTIITEKAAEELCIEQFIVSKNMELPPHISYMQSVYNTTTKEHLSDIYTTNTHLYKVNNQQVIEWYGCGVLVDGIVYPFVSYDLITGEVLDKYTLEGNVLTKQWHNSNNTTISTIGNIKDMELVEYNQIAELPFKDSIMVWSHKPYGFVVEYIK